MLIRYWSREKNCIWEYSMCLIGNRMCVYAGEALSDKQTDYSMIAL